MRIVVAGAGLSGLSICHALQEKLTAAGKSAEILLIESEGRVGGKVRTERDGGYVMEWGPNGFLNNKPDTLELCRKLGIYDKLLPSNDAARKRFIYCGGRMHKLSPGGFVFGGLLTWGGKMRILKEYTVPKRTDSSDETLADFTRRRLGQEALDKLIGPMSQGVYGGDPESMSLKSCFPTIYALEQTYGGLFKGLLGKRKEKKRTGAKSSGPAGPGGVLTSFQGGLDVLTETLKGAFKGEILLSAPVRKVSRDADNKGFVVHAGNGEGRIKADVFISASPAYAASEFMASIDPAISGTLSEIAYAPMVVVGLGYDKATVGHTLDGFGFLVGLKEGRKLIGVLWDSSVFAGRAPEGKCSIRCMAGGGRDRATAAIPDDKLTPLVQEELHVTMGIHAAPEKVRIFRHEKAIPMYTLGHSERLAHLDSMEKKYPGLFFGGNAYRGVGINDCVKEAYAVADKVMRVV